MLLVDALTALFVKKTERHDPFTALPVDTHTHILIRLALHMLEMPNVTTGETNKNKTGEAPVK